ncbi:MAG: glycoside hydrolase family 3 C-terminal domain-containing protein [Clostridia bacterium]|nr:glycoside hydrolase family 3 C-terminal domain-containing protein [Clostridia bacterium]
MNKKIDEILSQMTLEEKVAQMMQLPYNSNMDFDEALDWAKKGAGSFLNVIGEPARRLQEAACSSRLGIPLVFGVDAVRGHALNDNATVFPTQLACACSWSKDVAYTMGEVTAREVSADGLHWTFSPLLCLARDTRWGRVNETFGEDPYLVGELAEATIRGYQGDDLSDDEHILACAKHYIAYGESTGAKDAYDSEVTYRKIRELFLPPFKKAVDAGCATVMTAYGSVDGTPVGIDEHIMKDILRDELGFDGFVVTDWKNVTSLVTKQYIAKNEKEAATLSANGGNDMIMSSPEFYEAAIAAVKEGTLCESVIDDAVRNILRIKLRMGIFENCKKHGNKAVLGCEEHQLKALDAARRSVTLVKNNGVLPLDTSKKIAVIGKNADDIKAQYGDWTYFTHPVPDPDRSANRPYTTLKEGMMGILGSVSYAFGCGPLASDEDDIAAAVSVARNADVIVLAVGDEISQVGEKKDRADLALSGRQTELFYELKKLSKPIVTVLISSKPLAIPEVADGSDALIIAFNGGAHGGRAVAEVICGKYEPSGRLPISFPHHSGQLPVYYNHFFGWHGKSNGEYVEGKYCDMPQSPLFSFGEGLAYTHFEYSDIEFDKDTFKAAVTVKNAGERCGLETVQVYFRDMFSSVLTPMKQLIAYKQVELESGEQKRVEFSLKKEDFSLVNKKCERVVEPGEFRLMIGHSSKNSDLLTVDFEL